MTSDNERKTRMFGLKQWIGRRPEPGRDDYLSRDILLQETSAPSNARRLALAGGGLVALFLVWSALANADQTARAPGQLLPVGGIGVVQAVDGGRIERLEVGEGQRVRRGDVLAQLDDAEARADLATNEGRYWALYVRRERLRAMAEGRAPSYAAVPEAYRALAQREASALVIDRSALSNEQSVLEAQLREVRKEVADFAEIAAIRGDLAKDQIVARTAALEADRTLAQLRGQQATLERQIQSIRTDRQRTRSDELSLIETELVQVAGQVDKYRARVERARVTAPVDGIVHDVRYRMAGQVVAPAAVMMNVAPDAEPLRAEIRIPDRDVGGVKVGDSVRLRVNAFDYLVFGALEGRLTYVAPNSVKGEDGSSYYLGFAEIDAAQLKKGWANRRLRPGLLVEADITSGRRSVLQLLAHPVLRAFDAVRG